MTYSHPFFKKKSYSHLFFDKNDTLLPIFQKKRLTPTDSKNDPFPDLKDPLPSKDFTELLSQPLSATPSNFYSLSGIFIFLHRNFLRKRHALTRLMEMDGNRLSWCPSRPALAVAFRILAPIQCWATFYLWWEPLNIVFAC